MYTLEYDFIYFLKENKRGWGYIIWLGMGKIYDEVVFDSRYKCTSEYYIYIFYRRAYAFTCKI